MYAIRVLYAEDSRADCDLTQQHFEATAPDILLESVATGQECLERLSRVTYDALLLDNHLPDMDGADVLAGIAAANVALPVVVVTATGGEELVVRLVRLGAWDYVPKDGDYIEQLPTILRASVAEFRRRRRGRAARRSQRHILYVERHAGDIDLTLAHVAEHAPHLTFVVVRSSNEALAKLASISIDLVLTDLRMPDLNALELLREMRHRGVAVPLVVVTGRGDENAAVAALKLGAYDYLVKRDGYLTQLPHAIDNAIDRCENEHLTRRLEMELAERRRVEAEGAHLADQLQQAQKLDALGRLAGGVAHDFNNLLTVIIGQVDLVLSETGDNQGMRNSLLDVRRCAERAAALTSQLLAFSRRQILQPRILDLNAAVLDSVSMLRRVLGEDIELVTHLAPDLGRVRADPAQIGQVVLNLAVNARDAMPTGGRLTVTTANGVVSDDNADRVGVLPGVYVTLAVRDTGHAIAPETLPRIFEPFFTTKTEGHGTGLGLSTVYGIVKQSDGWIAVDSVVGQGTTFTIYLPRTDGRPAAVDDPTRDTVLIPGTETILLVEDEDSVRRLAARVLRTCGYHVIEAGGAGDALRASEGWSHPIALLIADVVMPQISGPELAERLRAARPELRVLFTSGYTDDAVVRHGLVDRRVAFLQKPFTPASLAQKTREVLNGS